MTHHTATCMSCDPPHSKCMSLTHHTATCRSQPTTQQHACHMTHHKATGMPHDHHTEMCMSCDSPHCSRRHMPCYPDRQQSKSLQHDMFSQQPNWSTAHAQCDGQLSNSLCPCFHAEVQQMLCRSCCLCQTCDFKLLSGLSKTSAGLCSGRTLCACFIWNCTG